MANIPATALSWPISLDENGKFRLSSTISELWSQRVIAVLSTRIGERVMRNDYGCGLAGSLFSPIEGTNAEQEIRKAMGLWLPRLTVTKVTVTTKGSELLAEVEYSTPDGSIQDVAMAYQKGVFGV